MKFEVTVCDITGSRRELHGATAGEEAYAKCLAPIVEQCRASENTIIVVGFRGASWVTGSFLKATWLRLCSSGDNAQPTAVAYLTDDVRTEFGIFCRGEHHRPGLEAEDWTEQGITQARLHGDIEETSWAALQLLIAHPGATAPALHSFSREPVSATAWTNRLNELCRLGLAVRRKDGRAWNFFPIMREVRRG